MRKSGSMMAAAMLVLGLSAGTAIAETWSCAINERGTQIQQYRVDGKLLKDLTGDKLLRDWLPDEKKFLGAEFGIVVNNKDAVIAESDYAGPDQQKTREIYVVSIITDKLTGNLIKTSILTHLPSPNEVETVYGSCTLDE